MPYSQSQSCLLCCRNVCARISPKWFNLPERSNLLFQPTVWIWGNYIRCNCSSGLSPLCYVSSKKLVFPFQGCSPYTCWPGTSIYSLYKVLWNRPRDSGEMMEMWYQECTIRSNSRIISSFLLVPSPRWAVLEILFSLCYSVGNALFLYWIHRKLKPNF